LRRRTFLLGGAAAVFGAGGLLAIRRRRHRGQLDGADFDPPRSADADFADPRLETPRTRAPASEPGPEPLFPARDWPLLLALADAIVPRDGERPAASEIDLLPQLERWARDSASRLQIYELGWPRLRALLERAGEAGPSGPSMRTLRALHRHYRFDEQPPREAAFFEQFRRDVLRVYYASPVGWASVAYTGPVHRSNPLGRPGAPRA